MRGIRHEKFFLFSNISVGNGSHRKQIGQMLKVSLQSIEFLQNKAIFSTYKALYLFQKSDTATLNNDVGPNPAEVDSPL